MDVEISTLQKITFAIFELKMEVLEKLSAAEVWKVLRYMCSEPWEIRSLKYFSGEETQGTYQGKIQRISLLYAKKIKGTVRDVELKLRALYKEIKKNGGDYDIRPVFFCAYTLDDHKGKYKGIISPVDYDGKTIPGGCLFNVYIDGQEKDLKKNLFYSKKKNLELLKSAGLMVIINSKKMATTLK